jgi:Alcohol dehydrogenase transcription factor Myb/SANT-like
MSNCNVFILTFIATIYAVRSNNAPCAVTVVGEVQKKIHSLRTQFVKECKRVKGKSGAGTDDAARWKYHQSLLFLHDFVSVASSTLSNLSMDSVSLSYSVFINSIYLYILRSCACCFQFD